MLERRDLGEAGLAYIRERLAGGKTLAKLLLDGLNLESGRVWTYLPAALSDAQVHTFDEGYLSGLDAGPASERIAPTDAAQEPTDNVAGAPILCAYELVVERLRRFLLEQPQGVVVWEDAQASATDTWMLNHPEEPLLFVGSEVYYAVTGRSVSDEAIRRGLETMVAWWGAPAVLATPSTAELAPLQQTQATITPEQLRPLVAHLRLLFFDAYDGEGYVLWSPAGQPDVTSDWRNPGARE